MAILYSGFRTSAILESYVKSRFSKNVVMKNSGNVQMIKF